MAAVKGKEAFIDYYKAIYQDRWDSLYAAMMQEEEKFPLKLKESSRPYFIDEASIFVAKSLEAKAGEKVLDMCAAPGGKSLLIADQMGGRGEFWSNEFSLSRRERLKKVLQEFLPDDYLSYIRVMGHDGGKYGVVKPNYFDRVLIDAPCSSERHLLQDEGELAFWAEGRTKRLSRQQFTLLCSGMLSVKPGGTMVYSTCSISPLENDLIVQEFVDRKGHYFTIDLPEHPLAEKTKHGLMFLPDTSKLGPIYMTRFIRKI